MAKSRMWVVAEKKSSPSKTSLFWWRRCPAWSAASGVHQLYGLSRCIADVQFFLMQARLFGQTLFWLIVTTKT